MGTNMEHCNRASSLPPSCLQYENHICELNLSVDATSTQSIRDTPTGMRTHQTNECSSDLTNGSDRTEMLLHSVKVSPSDSSGITDEDSGYFPTNSSSSRRVGSSNSIATSGQLNYEGSGGFVNRDELLQVMTEDLVDWFIQMYPSHTEDLTVENFFDRLSDGVLLCHHVTELHQRLAERCEVSIKGDRAWLVGIRVGGARAALPSRCPIYQTRGLNSANATSAFVSRDNVSNFLGWCRQLGMPDSILFESEDLVCRKNPRNVAVCLLELARLGGGVGMAIPELVQLEAEIDEELACDDYDDGRSLDDQIYRAHSSSCSSITEQDYAVCVRRKSETSQRSVGTETGANSRGFNNNDEAEEGQKNQAIRTTRAAELRRLKNKRLNSTAKTTHIPDDKQNEDTVKRRPEIQRPIVDMRSLDEIVRDLLSQCTCKQTFPMIRVSEGRYLFGDKCTQIFVRILRNHVMVRVGGGWDTLNHFLAKYDECRKINPPSTRVGTDTNGNPATPRNLDTTNPEALINALETTDSVAPLPSDSPIRGQGKLSAVKKSPPLEECDTGPSPCCLGNEQPISPTRMVAKHIEKQQNKPSQVHDTSISQATKLPQQTASHSAARQNNLSNGNQAKPTAWVKPKTPVTSPERTKRRIAVHESDQKVSRNLIQLNRSNATKLLPDRIRAIDIMGETKIEKPKPISNNHNNKTNSAADVKRSNQARRALASAPRTPVSNRSRPPSPGTFSSIHSKSSSSLVSCGLPQKNAVPNRQVSQPSMRPSRRFSEQPNRTFSSIDVRANGPQKSQKRDHTPGGKTTRSRMDSRSIDGRSIRTIREAKSEAGEYANVKKVESNTSSREPPPPPTGQNPSLYDGRIQTNRTNERRPSLIPRLIRCRSASQIPSVTTVECDSVPELL